MTGQKERACPCANTDKLNAKDSISDFNTDPDRLQYVGVIYYAADDHGHKFRTAATLRIADLHYRQLIHWMEFHLKGKDPPPALYALEILLQHLEYLRGGRHYLYNSICEITLLENAP